MPRARKRHVQQGLPLKDPNKPRGGRRPGAGRPPKGTRSSEPHKRRAGHDRRHPVHVTLRVVDGLGSLRKRDVYAAVREATIVVLPREDFRIVHLSIQRHHIHLIVEASGKRVLSRGLQAFQISAAKHINRAIGARSGTRRRGQVFADRYNARPLTSPRQVRNTIRYVLNNWRHHEEDRAKLASSWKLDPFSNAVDFPGWKERADSPVLYQPPPTYQGLVTWLPRTWLLRVAWEKHPAISVYDVPGPIHETRARPRAAR